MSRIHRARRLALQGLCLLDVQGDRAAEMAEGFIAESRDDAQTLQLARQLLSDVRADVKACDATLTEYARHWQLNRLALVDRNILRLAVCELRAKSAPPRVVIAEALKLAEEFSTAESPRFVNGILDAVARDLHGEIAGGSEDH